MPRGKTLKWKDVKDAVMGNTADENVSLIGRLMRAKLYLKKGGAIDELSVTLPPKTKSDANALANDSKLKTIKRAVDHFEDNGEFMSAAKIALAWKATADLALFSRHSVDSMREKLGDNIVSVKAFPASLVASPSKKQDLQNLVSSFYNLLHYNNAESKQKKKIIKQQIEEFCRVNGVLPPTLNASTDENTDFEMFDEIGKFLLYATYLQKGQRCELHFKFEDVNVEYNNNGGYGNVSNDVVVITAKRDASGGVKIFVKAKNSNAQNTDVEENIDLLRNLIQELYADFAAKRFLKQTAGTKRRNYRTAS